MITLAISFVITWAPYASDYTRYMKPATSPAGIFWATLGGLVISSVWLEILGAAAASAATSQTSGGIRDIMGGGALGALALVAIALGTIAVNAMNDYSGSLSLQAAGVRIMRPLVVAIVTVVAFGLTLWLQSGGNLASKFTNLVLFISYWDAPFAAVVIVDWWQRRGQVDVSRIVDFKRLASGWSALTALVAGFLAAVPFMNTTLFVGPVAPGLLAARGFRYDSSLMDGDTPYRIACGTGPDIGPDAGPDDGPDAGPGARTLIEMPIHWGLDDWEQYAYLPGVSGSGLIESPAKALEMWLLELDAMHACGGHFVLTAHPFLSGRPSRAAALERLIERMRSLDGLWIASLEEVAAYAESLNLPARQLSPPQLPPA
jgi:hypothetical protein